MIISKVSLDEEQEKTLLPPGARGLLKRRDTFVYAALEEGDFVGIAIVTRADSGIAEFCIRYLKAYNGEEMEIIGSLLKKIEKKCRQSGSKMMAVRIIDDFASHEGVNDILIKKDYSPIQINGRFLMYRFKDILETEFVKKVENLEAVKKYVKFYRQLDKRKLTRLSEKLKKSDLNLNFERPDMLFGRFFVVDGEILGYMDMREVYPGMLMLYDVYAEKVSKAKHALPMMIASVIQLTQATMPENTVIILPIYTEYLYKGFKTVFGKAFVEKNIYEYAKNITEEEDASGEESGGDEAEVSPEAEEFLDIFAGSVGIDVMSPAMLKGQRDIMPM